MSPMWKEPPCMLQWVRVRKTTSSMESFVFKITATLLILLSGVTRSEDTDDDWTKNYWNEWMPEQGNEIGQPIDVEKLAEHLRKSVRTLKENEKIELIFLVDSSSSIGNENFRSELKFVQKLVADFRVGPLNTRVAVVVFASSAETQVNHLEDQSEHEKCSFLHLELPRINYTGGNTDTIGALLRAQEILSKSRPKAGKAIFLVTDGFSNKGDPVPTAEKLKNDGISIFTFGIQTGNVQEVRKMSSTPTEDFSFVLDSFSEFEALARRALHEDLKMGTYVALNSSKLCNELCHSRVSTLSSLERESQDVEIQSCCNNQSVCSCGILTGHFACLCPPGYYGSGLIGEDCQPCPSGTYHDGSFPGDVLVCMECPDVNHETVPPATTAEDCKCRKGYVAVGNACEVVKCPSLSEPENGYFVKENCSNVLNAACGVRCGTGYKLLGSSVRVCQADGTWSGTEPSCMAKSCDKPKPVRDGSVTCRNDDSNDHENADFNYTVDTTCTFECRPGYTMIGSRSRTCLPILKWNGLATTCTVIKCPSLSLLKNGLIEPKNCTVGGLIHGFASECSVSCIKGYRLEGPGLRKCTGRRGTWTGKNVPNKCIDIEPPVFDCPTNITVETAEEESYALVHLSLPQGTDNSGSEPIIWSKPPFLPEYPLPLKIGITRFEVFATDALDNGASCEFFVQVQDNEPPKIYNCESPPTIYLSDRDTAEVDWVEPIFMDNSQLPLSVNKSRNFGNFTLGTTPVVYIVTDSSGNTANCTLNITVADNPCSDKPKLGNVEWNCTAESRVMTCSVSCPAGMTWTTANDLTNATLMCQYDRNGAIWHPDVFSDIEAVPECSAFEMPTEVVESHEIELDGKECDDLEGLSNNVSNELNILLGSDDSTNISVIADCIPDDSDEEETNIIRTKRQIPKRKKVRVRVKLTGKSSNNTSTQDVVKQLQKLGQKVEEYTKKPITIGDRKIQVQNSRVQTAHLRCNAGYALKRGLCVKCPQGTFHDQNNCIPCPIGTYQDADGQTSCRACPEGHLTRRRRRKQLKDCKKICPAGTYGKINNKNRKLAVMPCTPCSEGFYQPESGQTSCIECPEGQTTTKKGSSRCVAKAAIVDPCYEFRCKNSGTCFVYNGFPYCLCQEGYLGSFCERPRNHCDSSPCYNNGECEPVGVTGFTCRCPDGYYGELCQLEVNECESNPCRNGAECVDLLRGYHCECQLGYEGQNCEVDINECELYDPCQNGGTCHDLINNYNCTCASGYTGKHCEIARECIPDERVDENCRVIEPETHDPCFGIICPDNMDCIPAPGRKDHPLCICRRGYQGGICREEVNFNVILSFPKRSVTEYIAADFPEDDITEISVCLWIQTSDSFNYGTLFSYAVQNDDNTFTVTDYKGFVLYVRNQRVITDIVANDGHWHFICITWESLRGRWEIFLDGRSRGIGFGLSSGSSIPGRGRFIIGQEQDRFGGGFNEVESFVGKIAYFDVWKRVLNESVVSDMNEKCRYVEGDLYSWVRFLENIHGQVEIIKSNFCTNCNPRELRLHNGQVDIRNVRDSTFGIYECEKGYRIRFDDEDEISDVRIWYRKCLKHGDWEPTVPRCYRISCDFPGYFLHGTITGSSYLYSDVIEYSCNAGYQLIGNGTRVCLENGSWSGEQPTCKGSSGFCEQILAPRHGSMFIYFGGRRKLYSSVIGDRAEFVCDEGYRLRGSDVLTCSEGGFWDNEVPTCEEIICSIPSNLRQLVSFSETEFFKVGEILQVTCDDLGNPKVIQCQENGSWNYTSDLCDNRCKTKPKYPENGLLLGDPLQFAYDIGERVGVKCRYGYRLHGDSFFTCSRNGTWQQENETTCRPVECVKPIPPPNSYSTSNLEIYPFESRITFKCLPGFVERGELMTRCDREGRWTSLYGRCVGL